MILRLLFSLLCVGDKLKACRDVYVHCLCHWGLGISSIRFEIDFPRSASTEYSIYMRSIGTAFSSLHIIFPSSDTECRRNPRNNSNSSTNFERPCVLLCVPVTFHSRGGHCIRNFWSGGASDPFSERFSLSAIEFPLPLVLGISGKLPQQS